MDLLNGLVKLSRWTGTESCHRTNFQVPAIIVSYNMFMNVVDRMDQIRSTNNTRRREKRLSMTILTMVLDLCILSSSRSQSVGYPIVRSVLSVDLSCTIVADCCSVLHFVRIAGVFATVVTFSISESSLSSESYDGPNA